MARKIIKINVVKNIIVPSAFANKKVVKIAFRFYNSFLPFIGGSLFTYEIVNGNRFDNLFVGIFLVIIPMIFPLWSNKRCNDVL